MAKKKTVKKKTVKKRTQPKRHSLTEEELKRTVPFSTWGERAWCYLGELFVPASKIFVKDYVKNTDSSDILLFDKFTDEAFEKLMAMVLAVLRNKWYGKQSGMFCMWDEHVNREERITPDAAKNAFWWGFYYTVNNIKIKDSITLGMV